MFRSTLLLLSLLFTSAIRPSDIQQVTGFLQEQFDFLNRPQQSFETRGERDEIGEQISEDIGDTSLATECSGALSTLLLESRSKACKALFSIENLKPGTCPTTGGSLTGLPYGACCSNRLSSCASGLICDTNTKTCTRRCNSDGECNGRDRCEGCVCTVNAAKCNGGDICTDCPSFSGEISSWNIAGQCSNYFVGRDGTNTLRAALDFSPYYRAACAPGACGQSVASAFGTLSSPKCFKTIVGSSACGMASNQTLYAMKLFERTLCAENDFGDPCLWNVINILLYYGKYDSTFGCSAFKSSGSCLDLAYEAAVETDSDYVQYFEDIAVSCGVPSRFSNLSKGSSGRLSATAIAIIVASAVVVTVLAVVFAYAVRWRARNRAFQEMQDTQFSL